MRVIFVACIRSLPNQNHLTTKHRCQTINQKPKWNFEVVWRNLNLWNQKTLQICRLLIFEIWPTFKWWSLNVRWPFMFKGRVGGFRPFFCHGQILSHPNFFPPQNFPGFSEHVGGIGGQSSWKAFFQLTHSVKTQCCQYGLNLKPLLLSSLLWSPGS